MTLARVVLLAAAEDQQKAAPLGLFVVVLLGVACYFLFKSMSRHLKRVRDQYPGAPTPMAASRPRPGVGRSGAATIAARPGVSGTLAAGPDDPAESPKPEGGRGAHDPTDPRP